MPRGGPSGAFVTEWLTAYADYLRRAAEQSANTLDLYQQITDSMVRGELAPTATQDMLGSFVQARGTAYSDRLAQLNMRFFSEMVRIGTAFAHELGHALGLDHDEDGVMAGTLAAGERFLQGLISSPAPRHTIRAKSAKRLKIAAVVRRSLVRR